MAVALLGSALGTGNSNALVVAITLAAGSDRVIVSSVMLNDGVSVSGSNVVWDAGGVNEAFTQVRADSNSGACNTEIWYLVNPSTSTGADEVTHNTSSKTSLAVGVGLYSGATTPDNGTGSSADAVTSFSDTVSSVGADDMLQDAIRISSNDTLTFGSNQSQISNQSAGGDRTASSYQDGVDGGVMEWTINASADGCHSACRIPTASAAAVRVPGVLAIARRRMVMSPLLVR